MIVFQCVLHIECLIWHVESFFKIHRYLSLGSFEDIVN